MMGERDWVWVCLTRHVCERVISGVQVSVCIYAFVVGEFCSPCCAVMFSGSETRRNYKTLKQMQTCITP